MFAYRNPDEVRIYKERFTDNISLPLEERAHSRKYALTTAYLR